MPSRMSGNGRETIPDILELSESLPEVREWSGGHPGRSGVVGMPSHMSGNGRETLLDVREGSAVPLKCLGVVNSPSRTSGSGQEAFPDVWEWL